MTGTIGYEVSSGLGIQTKSFIDNGVIDKILVVPHSDYPQEHWYKDKQRVHSMEELLNTCDILMFIETPFHWQIIKEARKRGIKTILITMYECTPYPFPYYPDVLLGCSAMEPEHYKKLNCPIPCTHINAPVEAHWKLRTKAKTFIHNAGHGGIYGRNGTDELLKAMEYVKSPIKLIVRSQQTKYKSNDPRVEIVNKSVPYEELYKVGNVFLLPLKFGGSSLPMQEAFASGMPVMALDTFPTNTWLPRELLIPVDGYKTSRIGSYFEMAKVSPQKIAEKIDGWFSEDISEYSLMGKKWGEENNWATLKQKYEDIKYGTNK